MTTLSNFLEQAKYWYSRGWVKLHKPGCVVKYISGDIDYIAEYCKKDKLGNFSILSGHFSPLECYATGFLVECCFESL